MNNKPFNTGAFNRPVGKATERVRLGTALVCTRTEFRVVRRVKLLRPPVNAGEKLVFTSYNSNNRQQ